MLSLFLSQFLVYCPKNGLSLPSFPVLPLFCSNSLKLVGHMAHVAPRVHDPSGFISALKQFIFISVQVQFILNELKLSYFLTLEILIKISSLEVTRRPLPQKS